MATFEEVLRAEKTWLDSARNEFRKPDSPTIGLAFSGGGIRSATFNLGVLQGLARYGLLKRFDYLSTVSGGGYIGSWLVSWVKRSGLAKVEEKLGDYERHRDDPGPVAEPKEVNFLRDYSNYLTPRKGIFGGDTWAAIATYFRNLLLNQAILVAFLAFVLLLPWALAKAFALGPYTGTWPVIFGGASAALAALAVAWASYNTTYCCGGKQPGFAKQKWVLVSVVTPLFTAAFLLNLALWSRPGLWSLTASMVVGLVAYGGGHLAGWLLAILCGRRELGAVPSFGVVLWSLPAGAFAGLEVYGLSLLLFEWKSMTAGAQSGGWAGMWHSVSWGPPLFVVAFLLAGALHIGLAKFGLPNQMQEWLGRLGGWLLLFSVVWAGLFALAIFVPLAVAVWSGWIKTKFAVLLGWVLSTGAGLLLGRSPKTSGTGEGDPKRELIALVSPYVFVIGLMTLLSLGVHWLVVQSLHDGRVSPAPCWGEKAPVQSAAKGDVSSAALLNLTAANPVTIGVELKGSGEAHWGQPQFEAGDLRAVVGSGSVILDGKLLVEEQGRYRVASLAYWRYAERIRTCWLLICITLLLGLSVGMACRVDINQFSMNLLYRNRLVRCYLGATRRDGERHPNSFTGFDPNDDRFLADLSPTSGYDGPQPILCATLNVTHGERLAWQERKAESFVLTPHYCGFEFTEMHPLLGHDEGYQPTSEYAYPGAQQEGGVTLGTALSISGAAASPNMGFHTSPPLAFLMTVFDVRLGWWLANPRYRNEDFWRQGPKGGPPFSLFYLLRELFASTTDRSKYVYLSDGAHFENLAIYELVRRRCRHIVASDAGADRGMKFGDLGNAIRKCRSDFGVEISLNTTPIALPEEKGLARVHGVVGTIQYPKGKNDEPAFEGELLYLKTTITPDVPRDVLTYRNENLTFPHQTTADQWFDESQFESYRRLGLFSVESLGGRRAEKGETSPLSMEDFFEAARRAVGETTG